MKKISMLAVLLSMLAIVSCGSIENSTDREFSPDMNIPPGKTAVVFNANFSDPEGNLSTIDMTDTTKVNKALTTTDGPDAVIRSYGNRIYVINRYGRDTIQAIDPSTFKSVSNFSVGGGTNPQDIVVISDDKAYISRLDAQNDTADSSDVLIVNPLTGEKLGGIDLTPYTADDGDRLARAAQMVLVDNYLYVCMQDLPSNMLESANTNGKIAVINVDNDQIVDVDPDKDGIQVIELAGRNPSDLTYSYVTDTLYVADTGVYNNFVVDTSDANGGIEAVPRTTHKTEGIIIDDADLGGGVAEIRMSSDSLAYTIVNSMTIASFDLTTHKILNKSIYVSPAYWLPDFTINEDGNLLIAEQDFNDPGIVIVSPTDGKIVAGPIGVGAPPVSITFVE